MAPVDYVLTKDIHIQTLTLAPVLTQMQRAKLRILMLDTGRNEAYAANPSQDTGDAVVEKSPPLGTFISFSTALGREADDGIGQTSPYAEAVAKAIKRPGLDIFQVFNEVGIEVNRATNGNQQPWISSSPIDGDFYFAGPPATAAPK
jgi:uncharacterized caspase-like protein